MTRSARELLKSIHIHAAKGEFPAEVFAEISAFLGEPVHVGDTITIKPTPDGPWWNDATYPKNDQGGSDKVYKDVVPEGLEFIHHDETYVDDDGKTCEFSYREYKFPEAGPVGYLKGTDFDGAFVVDINGRRFRIDLHLDQEGDSGVVTFTHTNDDLTVFETWDHAEAVVARRAQLVKRLEANEAELKTADAEWVEYTRDDIKWNKEDIAEIDAGEMRLQHPFYIQVFGQPNFIQGEVFPTHEGRSGMCLATIETDWGDSGNMNILFACDEDGLPCRIWTEASSC